VNVHLPHSARSREAFDRSLCCARAASGHAATPLRSMMKSRRLAGREKSIVRGSGRSVMTLSPSQPEARSGAPMAYLVLRRQTKEASTGGRSGTARPFSVAPPQRPVCNAHRSKIFGSGIPIMSPRARTSERLTSSRLVSSARTSAFCQPDPHCLASVARLPHTAR
jgi:hypothetical protein